MKKTELIAIARKIIDRQFPGEWDRFKEESLDTLLDSYKEYIIEDGYSPEEALEFFKQSVFEIGKISHEGRWD